MTDHLAMTLRLQQDMNNHCFIACLIYIHRDPTKRKGSEANTAKKLTQAAGIGTIVIEDRFCAIDLMVSLHLVIFYHNVLMVEHNNIS